jgi:hypothetical protein
MATSITDKLKDGEYLNAWRQFKDENPKTYSAIGLAPVTGQLAAIPDYAEAMQRGSKADSMMAAASFLPGVKAGRMLLGAKSVATAARAGEKVAKFDQVKEAVTKQVDDMTTKPTLSSSNDYEKAWSES